MVKKSELGQTTIEYILLIAVIAALVMTFYKSYYFQLYFGPNGKMAETIKLDSEFGYRHAFLIGRPNSQEPVQYSGTNHPSFVDDGGNSRFFGPKEPYQ